MAYEALGVANLIRPESNLLHPYVNHPYLYLPPSQGEEVSARRFQPQKTLRGGAAIKQQALFTAETRSSTEVGVFFDQELFTRRPQRLSLENCG